MAEFAKSHTKNKGSLWIRIIGSNISAAIAAAKDYPLDWQHQQRS
jgi:hypothetical protein